MPDSDLIAFAAVLAALLSALYARHARDTAQRANDIAIHQTFRPLRLAVYQNMKEFSRYCSTYRTLLHLGTVNGTRDLVAQIESFKWEVDQHGPLAMPDVEKKASEFEKNAWQLQRLLDRIAGGQNNPHDPSYATAEENVDALVVWFANEHRELRALFQPYLSGV